MGIPTLLIPSYCCSETQRIQTEFLSLNCPKPKGVAGQAHTVMSTTPETHLGRSGEQSKGKLILTGELQSFTSAPCAEHGGSASPGLWLLVFLECLTLC